MAGAGSQQWGPGPNQDVSKGQRFQQHKAQQQAKQATAAEASSRPAQAAPMSSSGPPSSSFVSPPKKAVAFTDVVWLATLHPLQVCARLAVSAAQGYCIDCFSG